MQRKELVSVELTADEGMILTDGTHYAKAILLGFGEDESVWKEIPEQNKKQEDYIEIKEDVEPTPDTQPEQEGLEID